LTYCGTSSGSHPQMCHEGNTESLTSTAAASSYDQKLWTVTAQ